MTFIAAVAAGAEAVMELERALAERVKSHDVNWVSDESRAVAWRAHHPWVSSKDDGDTLVVLDGRLHNLSGQGAAQAELLLHRYSVLGADLARGLLGDFVVIVLDRKRSRILVCRDPLGVRPWYQSSGSSKHVGATDVATLCSVSWVDQAVDEAVALDYLAGLDVSRGPTFHRGIKTLPTGSTWLSCKIETRTFRHHTWDIRPEPNTTWDEAVQRCRGVLDEAVRCRVRALDSVTSELSGGLDSTAVVGTVLKLGFEDLVVGRLLFDGPRADEREYSDAAIRHWGLRAVSADPWLPTDEEWAELTEVMRRPPPDGNFIMSVGLYRAFQAADRFGCVTGLGGDDAFVSMPRESLVISAIQQHDVKELGRVLRADLQHPRQAWRQTWRPTLRHLTPRGRSRPPRYIAPVAAEEYGLTARFAARPVRLTGIDAIDARADGITSGYVAKILEDTALVDDLIGWRSAHPFLDPRLIRGTYGLNPWFPTRGGHRRALQVAAFGDRLPSAVRDRRDKAEFSGVMWARADIDASRRSILHGPLVDRGWLDIDGFKDLLVDAREGRANAALPFSRAVALDRWLR